MVTASYFTEEDEYRYGGNAGKNEPTLKFTAKVSAARPITLVKARKQTFRVNSIGRKILFPEGTRNYTS